MKYRLTHGTEGKIIPVIGEKNRGIRNADNPYHLQEAQWRKAISTEMKRVQNWEVYIDDGIYHRHEHTLVSKASEIMHKTQLDVINLEVEWRQYHIQHAVYGLNISLLTCIQCLSSLTELELLSGRGTEGSDSVSLPNTTGSSGLTR